MKRILVLAAVLLALVGLADAELRYTSVAATTTATYVSINAGALTVVNDGASSIYVRVFWEDETDTDSVGTPLKATTSSPLIKNGESLEFSRQLSVKSISILSASTSTVRLFYW